jgi:hypothetical protein
MDNSGASRGTTPQGGMQRRRGGIWWGLVLVAIGAIFLLQNIGALSQHFNWWAIFILVPALSALSGAWFAFDHSKRFDAGVRSALGGGLIILTVALMFMFNMDWGLWWPLMLIVPGLTIFMNGFPDNRPGIAASGWIGLSLWVGASVMLLGATFLANNLNLINLHTLFGAFAWWGFFILIPGIGALINALVVFVKSDNHLSIASQGLFFLGLVICAVAALALFGLNWNLLAPIMIIAIGIGFLVSYMVRR